MKLRQKRALWGTGAPFLACDKLVSADEALHRQIVVDDYSTGITTRR